MTANQMEAIKAIYRHYDAEYLKAVTISDEARTKKVKDLYDKRAYACVACSNTVTQVLNILGYDISFDAINGVLYPTITER